MIKSSIISTATITNKSENQDCHDYFLGQNFNGLYVADGLGSYQFAKLASEKVVDFFKKSAKDFDSSDLTKNPKVKFDEVFKKAKENLIDFSKSQLENMKEMPELSEHLYGATAISVFETDSKILLLMWEMEQFGILGVVIPLLNLLIYFHGMQLTS